MGGHAGGDVASRMAAEVVEAAVVDDGQTLEQALRLAHVALIEAGREGRGAPDMGTTCVACRLHGRLLETAWVGDSRLYRMRGGRLDQLSRDHSYVQSLVDAGELTAEAVATHPRRHVLAQCLGGATPEDLEVEAHTIPAEPGDRLLLCTDGLTGELADARIAELLAAEPDDRHAARALVDAALAAGGHDNVTVIVATV
ncbi:MAG: PP2C family protein-serine/threonine phosphatase, partial [Halofilum sp. (in: g-proteobacteria)]